MTVKGTLPLPLAFRDEANEALFEFCRLYGRKLPWRENRTPYRVWVSEVMLQQTRAEVVLRYYDRFLEALPDVRALAEVAPDRLAKLWEGLGYYRRASLMRQAAIVICEKHGGEIPSDYHALRALPGFGEYTAGAVSSFAFGLRVPAVDGNLLRVLARLFRIEDNILKPKTAKEIRALSWKMLPPPPSSFMPASAVEGEKGDGAYLPDGFAAATWNQAMMELGAQICLPNTQPRCAECPLSAYCTACADGCAEKLPIRESGVKRREETLTVLRVSFNGQYLVRRRADSGLLAGLYEFPNVSGALTAEEAAARVEEMGFKVIRLEPLSDARHIFTHITWHLHGYHIEVVPPKALLGGLVASSRERLESDYSIPSAFRAYRP